MRLDLVSPAKPDYRLLSNALRFLAIDMVEKAKSGHPGLPMGMADVATVLFQEYLNFDPNNPNWINRDRFVLSAGHGSALLYALLHVCGYSSMTVEELQKFRQLGSLTPGHPEYGHTPGIDTTTGPLGQGFANAVGMALSERMLNARLGDDLINHYTYVLCSDGDLMEGISQEALSFAGHNALSKLIVFFDDNHITIDGGTDLSTSDHQLQRFSASNWHVQAIDGHDFDAIRHAIQIAQQSDRPSLIACRTQIGYGSPNKAGSHNVHGSPLGDTECKATRDYLGWDHPPFVVPEDIMVEWSLPGKRGQKAYQAWKKRIETLDNHTKNILLHAKPPLDTSGLETLKKQFENDKPNLATRVLSQQVLEVLTKENPNLVGGSADLTPSNNTKASHQKPITSKDFSGSYIHFGIREHAMAAMMNGMSLHGGLIPYGGTFLVFADYLRPSLRLSAIMEQPVIYVLTHDSIGLGEDGPTHQPIEHLVALRAIPNLRVFRPADAMEVIEAWELALSSKKIPSILALTRQNIPYLRHHAASSKENLSAKGAYLLHSCEQERDITFIASGSEVHLAIEASKALQQQGLYAAVVSVPCLDLFQEQSQEDKHTILGKAPRLFIEAASPHSWYLYVRRHMDDTPMDHIMGIETFGASAPYQDLYTHFGLTVENIIQKAKNMM